MINHSTQLSFYYRKSPSFYNSSPHVSTKDHYQTKAFQNKNKKKQWINSFFIKIFSLQFFVL